MAATYLGDNTIPILADLIEHLSGVTGFGMVVDGAAPRTSADAGRHAAEVDVVWMCGYLTMSLLAAGAMPTRSSPHRSSPDTAIRYTTP